MNRLTQPRRAREECLIVIGDDTIIGISETQHMSGARVSRKRESRRDYALDWVSIK